MTPAGRQTTQEEMRVLTAEPFGWVRVEASLDATCARCGHASVHRIIALAEWLDHAGIRAQRQNADGLVCPRCEMIDPIDVPLIQFRRGDGIGLVVGLPARTAAADDEEFIRDVLAVAQTQSDFEGAGAVVSIRMAWWGSVYNRALGPRLVGVQPLALPETGDETERWRLATIGALGLPDVRSSVAAFLTARDKASAVQVARKRPELLSTSWRLTVDMLAGQIADAQIDEVAADAVRNRVSLLHRARLLGLDSAADDQGAAALDELIARASSAGDPDSRLAALRELRNTSDTSGALAVASRLALVQALHGSPMRGVQQATELLQAARESVDLARVTFGDEHEMTYAALSNLAVTVQERMDVDRAAAVEEARLILVDLAPRVALAASPRIADVATNLAAVVAAGPGGRAENPEAARLLLDEAAHARSLLASDDPRDRLIELVDEAAVLRSRVSGNLRVNAELAIERLRQVVQAELTSGVLTAPERVMVHGNLANALAQLRERDPRAVSVKELMAAAGDAIEAAATIDSGHPVTVQTLSNAGSILNQLYIESVGSDAPDRTLYDRAREALENAHESAKMIFSANHRMTLVAAANLAAICGAVVDGQLADQDRSERLLGEILDTAPLSEIDIRQAAATNLAQLRIGIGDWSGAAEAYAIAAAAHDRLVAQARTQITRLGEIVAGGDLATKRALALVGAGRAREAVDVLEANRARLRRDANVAVPGLNPSVGTAIVHVATCAYGTIVVEARAGTEPRGLLTTLIAHDVRLALAGVLNAGDTETRKSALSGLIAILSAGVVGPLCGLLDEDGAQVEELLLVSCGALASCPLHAAVDSEGVRLADRFAVRDLVSASRAPRPLRPSPRRAVAVIDPDGTLPFARSEREPIRRFAESVSEPEPARPIRRWLTDVVPKATLLHLACHGRLDPEDAMQSRFDLGGGQHFSVADLAEITTPQLDLVVASACQSGSANPDAPDELLGVGHALAHAGAKAVVASLWDADDAATALVVARMYLELHEGGTVSGALRCACRWVSHVTGSELGRLTAQRLAGRDRDMWLPYDLAIELSALSVHPSFRSGDVGVFAHPVYWAGLACLEA